MHESICSTVDFHESLAREQYNVVRGRVRVLTCSDAWADAVMEPLLRSFGQCKRKRAPNKAAIAREMMRNNLYPPGGKTTLMVPDLAGTYTPPDFAGEYTCYDEDTLPPCVLASTRSPLIKVMSSGYGDGMREIRRKW